MRRAAGPSAPRPLAVWVWPLALCGLMALLAAAGDAPRLALRYDRAALADGQWWRLLTAHAVHLGWAHALLNMAGVGLCAVLAPALFRTRSLAVLLLLLALGVSGLLWLGSPQVSNYAGFSGVLYGLFVAGLWPQRRDPLALLALAVVAGWMLWQWLGRPLAAEEQMIGGHIVSAAHVYGVAVAAAWLAARAVWPHRVSAGS
ncbi:MAG: hypothetical protein GAK30_02212 [Paracidovorax wautersii]|uniref:Peptidase S54 rhomboid domain-containing protein n=1 Tax=Paracidovorax wautersii TaxID=1177982 RepID=A0A7V8FNH5_9BURK|nr:MAG: hypothetical protein GAK30_02212 [Paracidovorax wautersii]